MDKDKAPVHGGGGDLTSISSLFSTFTSSSSSFFPVMIDPSSSSSSQSNPEYSQIGHTTPLNAGQFSLDVSRMLDFPLRKPGHTRAHSETLGLPDDISFYSDLRVVGPHDGPSLSNETDEDLLSAYLDIEKLNSSCTSSSGLSSCDPSGSVAAPPAPSQTKNSATGVNESSRTRHQHCQSMDGSASVIMESSSGGRTPAQIKKAMSAAKLADLALIDPMRAKRIWSNRQSAARSKERKMRYIGELEQKVQGLQTEAETLSAQLAMLQRDTNGLITENSELKLQLQTIEQQVHLQDALNDALREEAEGLKFATGQMMANGGPMMNVGPPQFGAYQQSYPHGQAVQSLLRAHQFQQLQLRPQHPELHPFQSKQQQLLHPHQPQRQQQQSPADLRMKCPMTSQNQKEGSSDSSSYRKE